MPGYIFHPPANSIRQRKSLKHEAVLAYSYKRPAPIIQKLKNYTYLISNKTKKQLEGVRRPRKRYALCGYSGKHRKSMVTCVSQIMTKRKTFPLKQKLTCANHDVYVATCIVLRYVINNILAKKQKYFTAANSTKVILLAHFTNALTFSFES